MLFRVSCFFLCTLSLYAERGYLLPWGDESSFARKQYMSKIEQPGEPENLMGKFAEGVILFHQEVISPVDGPRSHFRPTSSRYMLLAMRRHGLIKGFLKGCDRLLRENDEDWVYRTVIIDGEKFKWDPTTE